jgi:hypothetical protein
MGGASSAAKAKAAELEAAKLRGPDGQDFLRQLEFVSQQHGILEEVLNNPKFQFKPHLRMKTKGNTWLI